MDRAKEVGLRKVVGSSRGGLVFQFLTEAFVLTFLAFILALLLANVLMPLFNELLNKNYSLSVLGNMNVMLGLVALLLSITFLAGYYPAISLSAMQSSWTNFNLCSEVSKGLPWTLLHNTPIGWY